MCLYEATEVHLCSQQDLELSKLASPSSYYILFGLNSFC